MASEGTQRDDASSDGGHSTAKRAVAAAAATGAAAYAVRRLAGRHGDDTDNGEEAENIEEGDDEEASGGIRAKKDDLVETLSGKVTDAKKSVSKFKSQRKGGSLSGIAEDAWDAASGHLMPVVHQAAAAAGKAVAEKAPEAVRTEVVPHFIDGFQKAS